MIEEATILKFAINRYVIDGAKLLTAAEFDKLLAPYTGQNKDFSDVQYALEAVEALYAERGYSAVHVLLPEQELEAGTVHFEVIESRYGKIEVKDNRYFSRQNILNALPALHEGGVPRAKALARQLRLANESPARQLNVVLKAGEQDDEVDAAVLVTDSNPRQWVVSLDNSGSKETGVSRLGISYRDANLFNRDHVGQIQTQFSPQYMDRVKVLGGSYKLPLYGLGHSLEFFGGYSNINSVVGGLDNFQGGGLMFSSRYNIPLTRVGTYDSKVSLGLDWRKFNKVELTGTTTTVLYNEIVVTPLSFAVSTQGKLGKGDANANVSLTANVTMAGQGKADKFAAYDQVSFSDPKPAYRIVRFGAGYSNAFANDWQFRTLLNGQWSGDILIQGEQMRLGGADGVRGFSEGSETGEQGVRFTIEGYVPAWQKREWSLRGLMFADAGSVTSKQTSAKTSIAGMGFGVRGSYTERYALRMDFGRIMKAGNDPQQLAGHWRVHATLTGTF